MDFFFFILGMVVIGIGLYSFKRSADAEYKADNDH